MNLMPIPFAFIRTKTMLTWRDALWGYERQMIGWSGIVDLASSQLGPESCSSAIDLADIGKSKAHCVGDLLRELALAEPINSGFNASQKWLFLVLAWTKDQKERVDDPLASVETIYADFDYPIEIENFVRYMPPSDGFVPNQNYRQDNDERLFANWQKYLDECFSKFRNC